MLVDEIASPVPLDAGLAIGVAAAGTVNVVGLAAGFFALIAGLDFKIVLVVLGVGLTLGSIFLDFAELLLKVASMVFLRGIVRIQ